MSDFQTKIVNALQETDLQEKVEIDLMPPLTTLPTIVIEMEDDIITNIFSDKPELIGNVIILDTTERTPADPDFVPVTGNGMTGWAVSIDVQAREVSDLARKVMEAIPES